MRARSKVERLLRWYPPSWRARYGDELTALLEDTYGSGPVPWRARLTTCRAGLVERARQSGLSGDRQLPAARARSGALVVLCGWVLCMVAFGIPIKFDEGWRAGLPPASNVVPTLGFGVTVAGAGLGLLLVVAAVVVVLPAFFEAWRDQGWALVRRHVLRIGVVGGATVVGLAGVVAWAHTLTSHQRNGGLDGYTVAFFAVGVGMLATVSCLTAAVVSLTTALSLRDRTVALLGRMALGMLAALGLMLAGTIWWWVAMAANSPTGIGGRVPVNLLVVVAVMGSAIGVATVGARRIRRALPALT